MGSSCLNNVVNVLCHIIGVCDVFIGAYFMLRWFCIEKDFDSLLNNLNENGYPVGVAFYGLFILMLGPVMTIFSGCKLLYNLTNSEIIKDSFDLGMSFFLLLSMEVFLFSFPYCAFKDYEIQIERITSFHGEFNVYGLLIGDPIMRSLFFYQLSTFFPIYLLYKMEEERIRVSLPSVSVKLQDSIIAINKEQPKGHSYAKTLPQYYRVQMTTDY